MADIAPLQKCSKGPRENHDREEKDVNRSYRHNMPQFRCRFLIPGRAEPGFLAPTLARTAPCYRVSGTGAKTEPAFSSLNGGDRETVNGRLGFRVGKGYNPLPALPPAARRRIDGLDNGA